MTIERVRQALRGISGVHATPYRADGAVDADLLAAIVRRIAAAGVHNVVAGGNTGEFYTLTPAEIALVHETAIRAAKGRALVTAAVGRSLKEAVEAGRRAAALGADAVMAHQPLDPFAAPVGQADYFLAVADGVPVPLVAYVRSNDLGLSDLVRIAAHPNVAGVKFATPNLMLLAECLRASEAYPAIWVCGLAEGWAAPFHALGARGFTSGLVNVVPERSLAIHAALDRGDYDRARALVAEIAAFETMRTKFNNGANVTVVKEAMTLAGVPVGPVRPPGLVALDADDRRRLAEVLRGWGLDVPAAGLAQAAE
ncbi:MAG TPA: dihydrodipicolinate synthase family protein [Beijerinckiaceae bacterium]|jgi:4-hydroxy-tetrahydrodipicolinate synthase